MNHISYTEAFLNTSISIKNRGFEEVKKDSLQHPEVETVKPVRADSRSAGYDFFSKEEVSIKPGEQHLFWTDIKSYMNANEVLNLHVRSSVGIKRGLMLANTTGIIDSSYYENLDNDGNIGICLRNISDEVVTIKCGERIAQGIFSHYLVADDDKPASTERVGGIGSSGI